MISKLYLLILLSVLFSYAHCACQTAYFTNTSPCDTQATQIFCKEFTSRVVQTGQWQYFFLPLNGKTLFPFKRFNVFSGIEGNIELDFKLKGPFLTVFFASSQKANTNCQMTRPLMIVLRSERVLENFLLRF